VVWLKPFEWFEKYFGEKKRTHDFRLNNKLSFYTTLLCSFTGVGIFFLLELGDDDDDNYDRSSYNGGGAVNPHSSVLLFFCPLWLTLSFSRTHTLYPSPSHSLSHATYPRPTLYNIFFSAHIIPLARL